MGNIASQFATAFRDFVTDGVASSGAHDPIKYEIRAIGPLVEAALGAISLSSVDVIKSTRANLNADLAFAADSLGLVYGDATDANNDLYIKVGGSGSGSWTRTTILHDAIGGVAATQVAAKVVEFVDPKVALAEEWAENPEDDEITGNPGQFSAKHYAAKASDERALASDERALAAEWAANNEDTPVDGVPGQFSAKHYAAKASDERALAEDAQRQAIEAVASIPAIFGGIISYLDAPGIGFASSVSKDGITAVFSEPKIIGQYANGDWWIFGPVPIMSISPPAAVQASGTDGNGSAYINRKMHGTVVNPGNRSYAPDGLAVNNSGNGGRQGFDTLAYGVSAALPYDDTLNVDPGNTGEPLVVAEGTVMKFVSKLTDIPAQNRPVGLDMVPFTVVTSIPFADAIRPGVSRASKASLCRLSQFNLGVFQNLAPTANAPTYAEALDWVDRYIEASFPDFINNLGAKGINNHPEYGRNVGHNLHRALLCLHLNSFTSDQKRTLLSHMAAIADDLVARCEEGAVTLGGGGGNQWKKPVVAVCAAALGANAPASWLTYLSNAEKFRWAEDSQIFRVGGFDIALPRFNGDGRPRSAYTYQMFGSAEWGEATSYQPERGGSNWNAFYRDVVAYSLYPGALAVELTTGAKALWDHPEFWLYMDTVWLRREGQGADGSNPMQPFAREMATAYRPAKVAAPAILDAGIKGNAIWMRFDQALNEIATLPATSAFVVKVNGSPVTVSSVSIWRQNIGLALAAAVTGNDVVTVDYTAPGSNPARSVDNVNVASFTGRALTNRTDKVGGPNAAFPVVEFSSGVRRSLTAGTWGASSSFGTLALLKFRFPALPTGTVELIGNTSGTPGFRLMMLSSGALEIRFSNGAGTAIARFYPASSLAPNTDYDIIMSFDMTQGTFANGVNCWVNGVAQTPSSVTWSGGAGVQVGWARVGSAGTQLNFSNFTFRLGALYLNTAARVNLTNSANRALFTSVTSGNLDILTRGDGITGSIPSFFAVGNADQWNDGAGMNRGSSAGRFFVSSGAVTLVSGGEWI